MIQCRRFPRLRPACLAVALLAASAPAWSITTLSFTGSLANATTSQVTLPGTVFDFWGLALDSFTPFSISLGEEIEATVSFDGPYTLPTAVGDRFIRLFFFGDDLASLNPVDTGGGVELFLGGVSQLAVTNQGCGTSTALAACVSTIAPNSSSVTFDKAVFTFTIQNLGSPAPLSAEVTSADFDTVITTPVPEAQTWAMLAAGLGCIGLLLRRRSTGA